METESSTSRCLSNVWPNQPRTKRFFPFTLLSSEGKERDPEYEVVVNNWPSHLCAYVDIDFHLTLTLSLLAVAIASLNKKKVFILVLVLVFFLLRFA